MYIEHLVLSNIRTFEEAKLDFIHPDSAFRPGDPDDVGRNGLGPRPHLPNVNLLLGDNGSGKSTVLMAIALASLGPAARLSVLQTMGMIRRGRESGSVSARLCLQPDDVSEAQDGLGKSAQSRLASEIKIKQYGDLELHRG